MERMINMTEKNIRVVAQNCNDVNGFNIYLELSGRREYIMWHRHDGILFDVLKDGVYLNTLKREKPHKLFGSKRIAIQKRRICSSYDKYRLLILFLYTSGNNPCKALMQIRHIYDHYLLIINMLVIYYL